MPPRTHVVGSCLSLSLLTALVGCTPPRVGHGGANPLVGDWVGAPRPGGCAHEIELFADGTMEANYLNDDNVAATCSFGLLSWSADGANLRVWPAGGQPANAKAYSYALTGDALKLQPYEASDGFRMGDGYRAALDDDPRTSNELAGNWDTNAFFGAPAQLQIGADGNFAVTQEVGKVALGGRITVRDARTLDQTFTLGNVQRCLYRVSRKRLTLRCSAGDYPATFVGGAGEPALVLRRSGT